MSTPVEPRADRAWIADPSYGVPRHQKGLLAWPQVREMLERARVYWVSTVDPHGRPHATPVDGLWWGDALYFGGSPLTRRSRNLESNPAACVHLESGSEVVILHGDVRSTKPDDGLARWLAEANSAKYGYPSRPEDYQDNGVQIFSPSVGFAWKEFPKDVTRFHFGAGGG